MTSHFPELPSFPPNAKLFVGLFTTLMLAVCFWASWLYFVDQGKTDPERAARGNALGRTDSVGAETAPIIERDESQKRKPNLRRNLGLAHTHINGQTLLFFAMGAVFLFTSVPSRTKRITYLTLAASIVVHNAGLSGRGYASAFDDLLAISGVIILALIIYMAGIIYMDLLKTPAEAKGQGA